MCVCVCVRAPTSILCVSKTEINEDKITAHPSKDWKTNNSLIINLGHKSFFGQRAAANALFTSGSVDLSDWELSPKRDICVNSPWTQSSRTVTEEGTEKILWAAGWEERCQMLPWDMTWPSLTATAGTFSQTSIRVGEAQETYEAPP